MKKSLLLIFLTLTTNAHAQLAPAKDYSDAEYCQAIFLAEGGEKTKYPYGIRSVTCETKKECKEVCIRTVRNNRKRFAKNRKGFNDYISYLGSRYAPLQSDNDPQGLNRHWIRNVRYFLEKI